MTHYIKLRENLFVADFKISHKTLAIKFKQVDSIEEATTFSKEEAEKHLEDIKEVFENATVIQK